MEGCCVILYLLAVHICIHILPVGHHIYWRIVGPSFHFVPAENCHLNWLKYWYFSCISSIWKASTNISIEHHFQGLFPRFFSKINFTNPKTKNRRSVCPEPLNRFWWNFACIIYTLWNGKISGKYFDFAKHKKKSILRIFPRFDSFGQFW